MGVSFYKSGELNKSSYIKTPLRSSAILKIENDDKYCNLWSILAELHPCEIKSNRVSNYRQYFDDLNIDVFDFSNEFKCSDKPRLEKLSTLSINI